MALQLFIQEFTETALSEDGTTVTNIKITGHGLETGDMIVNRTWRYNGSFDPCSRIVTKVDDNNLTVNSITVTGQSAGETIARYKYIDRTVYLKTSSLNVSDRLDRRNDCSFRFVLPDDSYIPAPGQNVKVVNNGEIIFGGAIKLVKLKRFGMSKLQADITSEGFNHVPARRTVPADYVSKSSKEIIIDLMDNYLSQEGITYTAAEMGDGAYWDEYPESFANNCISIKDILDDMANASGYKWYIDNERELHFFAEDAVTVAPHIMTDLSAWTDYRNIEIEETLINYRNKQFVRGGGDDFGDTIMMWQQSKQQILDRQDIEGGSGVYGSILSDDNLANTVEITAATGTTETNITFTSHGLQTGDMIINTTRNNAKRIIVVVDANNFTVTSDGVIADFVDNQTVGDKIRYYPDANVVARNNLKRYGKVLPKELSFETGALDFRAGQKLTVNLAEFGMSLDEYFLIEEVNFFDTEGVDGDGHIVLRANIKATSRDANDFSTQHTKNWIDSFASFAGGGGNAVKGESLWTGTWVNANAKTWKDGTAMGITDDYTSQQTTEKAVSVTLTKAEAGYIYGNSATPITLTLLTTLTTNEIDKIDYWIVNKGTGAVTIGATVSGAVNPTLAQYGALHVHWDGTAWYSI